MRFFALPVLLTWVVSSPVASRGTVPGIVVQPQNQMLLVGSNATFSVGATGGNLQYLWEFDAVDIGKTTRPVLTLSQLQAGDTGDISVVVSNGSGSVTSSIVSLIVLTKLTGPVNPYAPGTLGYDLFQGTYAPARSTSKMGSYSLSNLGTNTALWTWPVNLSCVGVASDGYQSVLITRNKLLVCAHNGGEVGQTVTFHDTNGVAWTGVVTNVINVIADMDIAGLSNAAPATIVLPRILPPDYTNYIAGQSLFAMPAFWLHKNTAHIDYAAVAFVGDLAINGNYGTWLQLVHDGYGQYGGTAATGGDSGSPAFMIWSNNPVLLFATTYTPDAVGMLVSGETNWNSLAALGLTNGMNIMDLSGYPLQSATPPAPDYYYVVPPASQTASPETWVTFDVNVSIF